MQALPAGDWLMGYGNLPNFTEYSSTGALLLDGTLGRGLQSFRTYLSPWSGHPSEPPAIAATRAGTGSGTNLTVYTSWNGATEVASWRILVGESPSTLTPATTVPDGGFETSATLSLPAGIRASSTYVQSRALSAGGAVLGSSAPLRVS
jgi:hypothetical protein